MKYDYNELVANIDRVLSTPFGNPELVGNPHCLDSELLHKISKGIIAFGSDMELLKNSLEEALQLTMEQKAQLTNMAYKATMFEHCIGYHRRLIDNSFQIIGNA